MQTSEFGYRPQFSELFLGSLSDVDTTSTAPTNGQLLTYSNTTGVWGAEDAPIATKNNYSASADPTVNDDSGSDYSVGSRWVNTTSDAAFVCLDASAGAAVWKKISPLAQSNIGASTAPTTGNDSSQGYSAGSIWVDTTADRAYICLDASVGSAVWAQITPVSPSNYSASSAPTVNDDSNDGYTVGSFWVNTTADLAYICLDASVGAAVWRQVTKNDPLSNYSATTNPTVNDDSGDGYAVGSAWLNTNTSVVFICTDASSGAAVWAEINPIAYGVSASKTVDQTFTGARTTVANYSTVNYIVGDAGDFNSTTGVYTVQEDGYYMVSGALRTNAVSGAVTGLYTLILTCSNGQEFRGYQRRRTTSSVASNSITAQGIFSCSSGDTIYMDFLHSIGSSITAGEFGTFLSIQRL